jgi:predicted lactoylglutathione lyase
MYVKMGLSINCSLCISQFLHLCIGDNLCVMKLAQKKFSFTVYDVIFSDPSSWEGEIWKQDYNN